jgi:HD-GYP domain-containing protein (c-di-GMP phosphodiesterase class II)
MSSVAAPPTIDGQQRCSRSMVMTLTHGSRTAWLAGHISRFLGLSDAQCARIETAARTHDVGKLLVDRRIVEKPSALSAAEREGMNLHCVLGATTLALQLMDEQTQSEAVLVALLHHECWDGSGYPFGLRGQNIPLAARIAAVADVFDALTSRRSYKPAWSTDLALTYIVQRSGTQFDPRCVHALMSAMEVWGHVWCSNLRASAEHDDPHYADFQLPSVAALGDLTQVQDRLRRHLDRQAAH